MTTAKLMKAHASTTLPASDTQQFVDQVGGKAIDIDSWDGYVEGTTKDALFVLHFSGLLGTKAVAGLSLAFLEDDGSQSGSLDDRLASASKLEVRFHDGTGTVSSHTFPADGSGGTTDAEHQSDATSDALLKRAFNDAETLLRLPVSQVGGGDKATACMASFLAAISGAMRCVDDAGNVDDCAAVRNEAVLVASSCDGPKTANVLAGHGAISPQTFRQAPGKSAPGAFPVGGSSAGGVLGSFASMFGGGGSKGGIQQFKGLLGGVLQGFQLLNQLGPLLGGLGGTKTSGASGGLGGLGALGSILGGLGGAGGSGGLGGLGNILGAFNPGAFKGVAFGSNQFGNNNMLVDALGGVSGQALF
jgi:hypothetical protein